MKFMQNPSNLKAINTLDLDLKSRGFHRKYFCDSPISRSESVK